VAVLARSGIADARVDAELLVGFVLGASRGQVQAMTITDTMLAVEDAVAISEAIERRAAREPLQHITGVAAFRHLELEVGPGVFVPRPETEFVAGLAIDSLRSIVVDPRREDGPIAVDLGTGTVAVENSSAAFVWTKQNFRRVNAPNARLVFIDLADAVPELDGTVSVVVSNPPYIPSRAIPRDPEVRLFDPEHALYGGEDGLDVVRNVSQTGLRLLHPGGVLVIEHGELQGEDIRRLLHADGWRAAATHRDLTGRDRATTALR
jgi:release factor glutamine methyltransferase